MRVRKYVAGLLAFLLLAAAGTAQAGAQESVPENPAEETRQEAATVQENGAPGKTSSEDGVSEYTIGVVVYDPDSTEMGMFMNYYRDYIQAGFPVKFYFSGAVATAEEENAFIQSVKDLGAQGVISFAGYDLLDTLEFCREQGMYYVLGSGTVDDGTYEEVKDNPYFLGCVGQRQEEICESGRNMAEYFLETAPEAEHYIIMSGGASRGNNRHAGRTQGMLEVFQEQKGLILEDDAAAVAQTEETTVLHNADQSLTVTICPDYTEGGDGLTNLEAAFAQGDCDALMSAFHASTYLDKITEQETAQGKNIMVGAIDSFTEQNFELIKEKDAFGNPSIDYVEGKYASMGGPAFAMLYNAISGYPETNTPDGNAVRLYQSLWAARGRSEFIELYGYTSGIYENAYSCEDLMQVIRVFNEEALKELTESCTVEDVKARILG